MGEAAFMEERKCHTATAALSRTCCALLLITLAATLAAEGQLVTTLAGSGASGSANGPAMTAMFHRPKCVAVMQNSSVVVGDTNNNRICLVAPDGTVTTLAGGTAGFADGPAMTAQFFLPSGVAVMQNGSVVVSDTYNHRIRLVAPDGTATTLAGSGTQGFADGTAMTARFNYPYGVAVMQNGSVVVSDTYNHRIRLVAPNGTVTTLAGSAAGFVDGPATTAQFDYPSRVAVMQNGSVVVADVLNNRIRLVAPDGTVTTLAGSGTAGFADGPAMTARFYNPDSVAFMQNGSVLVAERDRIRLVFPDRDGKIVVTTLAGCAAGFVDGPAMTAQFNAPNDVAAMQNGSIVVADTENNRIRLIDDVASTLCTVAANCNNHATSVSGTFSSGCTCTCSTGYSGEACSTPTACTNTADCNGHASNVSGTFVSGCTCTCSTRYTGETCSSCSTFYTGYPTCALSMCGTNITLTLQPPAIKLLSVSLSQDNADVTMVLRGKTYSSVVVVYQRDVDQTAPSRQLAGISHQNFNVYATCAAAPTGILVAADGTGTVMYSHSVDYTLCKQGTTTDGYVVITCAFAVEHYVWPAAEYVPLMTMSQAALTIRVPRTLEQAIEAERFTFQIFPGLLVATARSADRISSFTLVQSSSWIAGSSMCTLSTDALSFSCMLHPMAAEGQHFADFQVVFVNDEASSVGVPVSVRTHYVGMHVPNSLGAASPFTSPQRTFNTAPRKP